MKAKTRKISTRYATRVSMADIAKLLSLTEGTTRIYASKGKFNHRDIKSVIVAWLERQPKELTVEQLLAGLRRI